MRKLLWTAAVAAGAFAVLATLVVMRAAFLIDADTAVSSAAHDFAVGHPAWLDLMSAVTLGGDATLIAPAAAVAAALLAWRRRWRALFVVAVGLAVIPAVRLALCVAIGRARPEDRLAPALGWAFPSGHTTTACSAALICAYLLWPLARRRQRVAIVAGAVVWAGGVAVSRVALVVHWPTDVIGGLLLAVALVALIVAGAAAIGNADTGVSGTKSGT